MIPSDTICALATPPGVSGLAVVRLSGKDAFLIADTCLKGNRPMTALSHTIHYGKFHDNNIV